MNSKGTPDEGDQALAPDSTQVDPLPHAGISEILGLLEVLDDRKGREKIYTLARDLNFDFGNLLLIIKAAEMLDFIYTPGAEAVLKALGKKMIETDMNSKKKLLLSQLRKVGLFKAVRAKLQENSESRVSQREIQEMIQGFLPKEKPELVFETLINWGRYAEFLGYSQDDGFVYLDQG
jgi:NitT/TauT family transport system ATP-binding protein